MRIKLTILGVFSLVFLFSKIAYTKTSKYQSESVEYPIKISKNKRYFILKPGKEYQTKTVYRFSLTGK